MRAKISCYFQNLELNLNANGVKLNSRGWSERSERNPWLVAKNLKPCKGDIATYLLRP
jgi:hypothetical protein